jgi:hypothetical protein
MVLSCLRNYILEMISIHFLLKYVTCCTICHVLYNILKTNKQKATNSQGQLDRVTTCVLRVGKSNSCEL